MYIFLIETEGTIIPSAWFNTKDSIKNIYCGYFTCSFFQIRLTFLLISANLEARSINTVATDCVVRVNDILLDTLRAGTPASVLDLHGSWPKADTALAMTGDGPIAGLQETEVCFEGVVPRIFAVEPKGQGVQWHGVPMRGSSGTLFRKLDRPHFTGQLRALSPELVILQYGGNVVPHCKDLAQAERFGGWFGSQIRLFQRVLPKAAILVIGPSSIPTIP